MRSQTSRMRRLYGLGSLPVVVLILGAATPLTAFNNGLARTPPMGWNTFNQWGGEWEAPLLKLAADSLVSLGLRDCGYLYVNADGNNRGSTPYWPAYSGFVNWAKPIAEYMHGKGLKFGVYTSEFTNPQRIASDLAAAGVDLIKVDAWTTASSHSGWRTLGDALVATGKPIVYSTHSSEPGNSNMWRTGGDIGPKWEWWTPDFDANYASLSLGKPGDWPDPDMLETGCRAFASGLVLSYDESRSQFSMWCMMSSPLIIGFDVTRTHTLNAAPLAEFVTTIAILSNTELIALDQDTIGLAGRRIKGQGALEVWIKNCADGAKAVAFFNRTASAANMSISQAELGWSTATQIYVRDLWAHADVAPFSGTFTRNVASHAADVYKMATAPVEPPTGILRKMDRSIAWLKGHGVDLFPQRLVPSVMSGWTDRARIFDLRGRALQFVCHAPAPLGLVAVRPVKGP